MQRYPVELSGEQRHRIRQKTLAVNPSLIVAAGPVSALDIVVRAQMLTGSWAAKKS